LLNTGKEIPERDRFHSCRHHSNFKFGQISAITRYSFTFNASFLTKEDIVYCSPINDFCVICKKYFDRKSKFAPILRFSHPKNNF